MNSHQIHFNDFTYQWDYGQSDCAVCHLVMTKYIYECCNVGTLYFWAKFLDVAKFISLTPLSLLISCKLSFSMVSLITSPLPTLVVKTLTKYSWEVWVTYWINVPVTPGNFCSLHQFYPLLGYEHLEQWYDTSILSLTNSTLFTADMILLCTKEPLPNLWFSLHFPCKMCILLLVGCHCPPSNLTY
jgi:hypothetical protein